MGTRSETINETKRAWSVRVVRQMANCIEKRGEFGSFHVGLDTTFYFTIDFFKINVKYTKPTRPDLDFLF